MKTKDQQKLFNDLRNVIATAHSTDTDTDHASISPSTSTVKPAQPQPPTYDNQFLDQLIDKWQKFETFDKSGFEDILRSTSRLILSETWSQVQDEVEVIDNDKKNLLKEKISSFDHFPSLYVVEINSYRKLRDYLVLLIDNPWPQEILAIMKDYDDIDITKALHVWQLEGPIILETRIENMLTAKDNYSMALSLVKIGILMGLQKNSLQDTFNIQQPEDQPESESEPEIPQGSELDSILSWIGSHNENIFHKYQDLFFVLHILEENYTELDEWLLPEIAMKWAYTLFALALNTPEGQIAPYWSGWKEKEKIKNGVIIMAMRTTWRILKNTFFTTTDRLKNMFSLIYILTEIPDGRPKPESQLNTEVFASIKDIQDIDHVYTLVEYIIEDKVERKYVTERAKLFLELLTRTLAEELNRIQTAEPDSSTSEIKSMNIHLSSRFKMALKYLQSYPILTWEFTLTAFSLHPTVYLKKKLFDDHNLVIKSYSENMDLILKELECMNLSVTFMNELSSVIKGRRIKPLLSYENATVLRERCEEHLHFKGSQLIEKGHLSNLEIDSTKHDCNENSGSEECQIKPKRKFARLMEKEPKDLKKVKLDDDAALLTSGLLKVPKDSFIEISSTSKPVENSQNELDNIVNNPSTSPSSGDIFEKIQLAESEIPIISSFDEIVPCDTDTAIISPTPVQNIDEIDEIMIETQNIDEGEKTIDICSSNIGLQKNAGSFENQNIDEIDENDDIMIETQNIDVGEKPIDICSSNIGLQKNAGSFENQNIDEIDENDDIMIETQNIDVGEKPIDICSSNIGLQKNAGSFENQNIDEIDENDDIMIETQNIDVGEKPIDICSSNIGLQKNAGSFENQNIDEIDENDDIMIETQNIDVGEKPIDICSSNIGLQKNAGSFENQNIDEIDDTMIENIDENDKTTTTDICSINIGPQLNAGSFETQIIDEDKTTEICPINTALQKDGELLNENEFGVEVEVEVPLVVDSNENCDNSSSENTDNLSDSDSDSSSLSSHSDRTTLVDSDSDSDHGQCQDNFDTASNSDYDSSSDSDLEQDLDCQMVYETPPPEDDELCNSPNLLIKKEVEEIVKRNHGSLAIVSEQHLNSPALNEEIMKEMTTNNENILPPPLQSEITLTDTSEPDSELKEQEISESNDNELKLLNLKRLRVQLKRLPLKKSQPGFKLYI